MPRDKWWEKIKKHRHPESRTPPPGKRWTPLKRRLRTPIVNCLGKNHTEICGSMWFIQKFRAKWWSLTKIISKPAAQTCLHQTVQWLLKFTDLQPTPGIFSKKLFHFSIQKIWRETAHGIKGHLRHPHPCCAPSASACPAPGTTRTYKKGISGHKNHTISDHVLHWAVSQIHSFNGMFPLQTIHFWAPPFMETPISAAMSGFSPNFSPVRHASVMAKKYCGPRRSEARLQTWILRSSETTLASINRNLCG